MTEEGEYGNNSGTGQAELENEIRLLLSFLLVMAP